MVQMVQKRSTHLPVASTHAAERGPQGVWFAALQTKPLTLPCNCSARCLTCSSTAASLLKAPARQLAAAAEASPSLAQFTYGMHCMEGHDQLVAWVSCSTTSFLPACFTGLQAVTTRALGVTRPSRGVIRRPTTPATRSPPSLAAVVVIHQLRLEVMAGVASEQVGIQVVACGHLEGPLVTHLRQHCGQDGGMYVVGGGEGDGGREGVSICASLRGAKMVDDRHWMTRRGLADTPRCSAAAAVLSDLLQSPLPAPQAPTHTDPSPP